MQYQWKLLLACMCIFASEIQMANAQSAFQLRSSVDEVRAPSMGLRSSFTPGSLQDANPLAYQSRGFSFTEVTDFRATVHDPLLASGFTSSPTYAASATLNAQEAQNARQNMRVNPSTGKVEEPVQLSSVVRRKRAVEEEDPYAPLGIRLGSFLLFPAVETGMGYSTDGSRGDQGAVYRILPELRASSQWSRHAVNVNLRGGYDYYEAQSPNERPFYEADVSGRLDIGHDQTLEGGALYRKDREQTNSLDAQVTGAPADVQTIQGRGIYSHNFGYLQMQLRSSLTHYEYDDATNSLGVVIDNSDRNYWRGEYALRGTYNRGALLAPFAEVAYDTRTYDDQFDASGYERDSSGWRLRGGVRIAEGKVLSGEIAAGYLQQNPEDSRFAVLRAAIVDGNITWKPSALTTIIVAVSSDFNGTATSGTSGYLSRRADLTIRHALLRQLILSAGASYEEDQFQDISRTDKVYGARAGVDYFFNRYAALRLIASHEKRDSNIPGQGYQNSTIEARLRLQR